MRTDSMKEDREKKKKDDKDGYKFLILPTESLSDYAEHPQVSRMYLTDIGYFPTAKWHYRERRRGCEEYIFFFCVEGEGSIIVEGTEYRLHANEAFCIPKNKSHRYFASQQSPWSIFWMHLKGTDIQLYPIEKCQIVRFSGMTAAERMIRHFRELFLVLEETYTLGNFIYISQVLSVILAETYCREKDNSVIEQNKHVTAVIKYMHEHLHENLTLERIADEFELSKSYLNVVFQKYTQHAPIDFFTTLKMKEACKYLKATDMFVYEIAQRLGYSDQYHFSKTFKRVMGVSPKQFKNGIMKDE